MQKKNYNCICVIWKYQNLINIYYNLNHIIIKYNKNVLTLKMLVFLTAPSLDIFCAYITYIVWYCDQHETTCKFIKVNPSLSYHS